MLLLRSYVHGSDTFSPQEIKKITAWSILLLLNEATTNTLYIPVHSNGTNASYYEVTSLPVLLPILLAPDARKQDFVDLDPLALVSRARGLVLGPYRRATRLGRSSKLINGDLRRRASDRR